MKTRARSRVGIVSTRPRHRRELSSPKFIPVSIPGRPSPRGAKGRSKRKRRKSHSVQRRAIDRGDEARSAICTRDRPLRRISRTDERGRWRARARTLGTQACKCVTHRRVACADRFRSSIRWSLSLSPAPPHPEKRPAKKISRDYPDLVRGPLVIHDVTRVFCYAIDRSAPTFTQLPQPRRYLPSEIRRFFLFIFFFFSFLRSRSHTYDHDRVGTLLR